MKVLFITTSYPIALDSVSGPFIKQLVDHLCKNAELTVLTPSSCFRKRGFSGKNPKLFLYRYAPIKFQILAHTKGGIPGAIERNKFSILLVPQFLLAMFFATLLRSENKQLIHANWAVCGAIAGIAGLVTRTPVITTLRGSDIERSKTSFLDRLFLRLALLTSDAIVTVSTAQRKLLLDIVPTPNHKLHTIFNGVGDQFFAAGNRRNMSLHPKRLLTVGRLVPGKEVETILRALEKLKQKDLTLTVVGEGPERTRLNHLAKELKIENRVSFVGNILHDDMPNFYRSHDIFILASKAEGRSNALLEAIATRTPVICSSIASNLDLVEKDRSGRVFIAGDAASLAEHLSAAINDPQQSYEMAEAARHEIIAQGLTWDNCADNYLKIYRELTIVGS